MHHVHKIYRKNFLTHLVEKQKRQRRTYNLLHNFTSKEKKKKKKNTYLETSTVINRRLECYPRDEDTVVPVDAITFPNVQTECLSRPLNYLHEIYRVLWVLGEKPKTTRYILEERGKTGEQSRYRNSLIWDR